MTKQTLKAIIKAAKEVEENIINIMGGKPLSPSEIEELISIKADKTRVEDLDDMKADKVEFENYKSILSHNNGQMINLLAILIEHLQLTIPKGSIAENTSTTKRGNILKRMYNLFQNVNNNEEYFTQSKLLHR